MVVVHVGEYDAVHRWCGYADRVVGSEGSKCTGQLLRALYIVVWCPRQDTTNARKRSSTNVSDAPDGRIRQSSSESRPALAVPDLAPLVHLSPTAMHLALLPPAAWSQINRQIRLCMYSLHDVYTTIALVDFFVSPTLCTGHRRRLSALMIIGS